MTELLIQRWAPMGYVSIVAAAHDTIVEELAT